MSDMQTVVGLFEDVSEAQRAAADLEASGLGRDSVRVISNTSDLGSVLSDIGMPDSTFYQEGVRRGSTLVAITTTAQNARRASEILSRYDLVDVDTRSTEYRSQGAEVGLRDYSDNDYVLPVVEEELRVGKRNVERGRMRVYTRVVETPVEEQVTLREETVHVERRAVDRPLTEADRAMQDQTIEVTTTGEEAVVGKTARVIEEVVVSKEATTHTETVRDTVRRTDVDVEQIGGQSTTSASDYSSYDTDFQSHYQQNFANSGYTYEQYTPVYRYGYSLANDERYRGRDWADVESDARTHWEERNSGTWEQFKDSVRYAWDKARGKR